MSNGKDLNAIKKLMQQRQGLANSVISINDLREKDYSGYRLNEEEQRALNNYEKYRLNKLNDHVEDEKFNEVYQLLQVMANLRPWQDFLDSKFES